MFLGKALKLRATYRILPQITFSWFFCLTVSWTGLTHANKTLELIPLLQYESILVFIKLLKLFWAPFTRLSSSSTWVSSFQIFPLRYDFGSVGLSLILQPQKKPRAAPRSSLAFSPHLQCGRVTFRRGCVKIVGKKSCPDFRGKLKDAVNILEISRPDTPD